MDTKDYHVVIDGKSLFNQPIKNNLKTYVNIRKIATTRGDNFTTGSLLDYSYFKKYYKLIAIDLSKKPKRDANPKVIQQINFTGNPTRGGDARMYFIIEEVKETVLDFQNKLLKYYDFISF